MTNPQRIIDFGTAVERLHSDETFRELMQRVIGEQTAVFLDDRSTAESREDAHQMVRATNALARYMANAIDAKNVELQKLDNTGVQDRGSD